jgi:hypothetical protein
MDAGTTLEKPASFLYLKKEFFMEYRFLEIGEIVQFGDEYPDFDIKNDKCVNNGKWNPIKSKKNFRPCEISNFIRRVIPEKPIVDINIKSNIPICFDQFCMSDRCIDCPLSTDKHDTNTELIKRTMALIDALTELPTDALTMQIATLMCDVMEIIEKT